MSPRQKFIDRLLRNGAVLVGDPRHDLARLRARRRRMREQIEAEREREEFRRWQESVQWDKW